MMKGILRVHLFKNRFYFKSILKSNSEYCSNKISQIYKILSFLRRQKKSELTGKTLVIKGEGGLSNISNYLNSASFKTDELNTYNRQKFENYIGIKKQFSGIDFVIFSSALAVEIYFEHIHNNQDTLKFLAVSKRIQDVIGSYKKESKVINYFSDDLIEEIKLTLT